MANYWPIMFGALVFELLHWYQLREKLDEPKYRRLLGSARYWVPTVLFTLIIPVFVAFFLEGRSTVELLVAGAALPTTVKKLIAVATARQETKLGPEDENKPKWSEYFSYS